MVEAQEGEGWRRSGGSHTHTDMINLTSDGVNGGRGRGEGIRRKMGFVRGSREKSACKKEQNKIMPIAVVIM